MKTTNYHSTLIAVAEDCTATVAGRPPTRVTPTIAELQHDLIAASPYELTSDDVLFEVHARRTEARPEDRERLRAEFFAQERACLRASPLPKRYGWGIHHDEHGRVALVAVESERYRELEADPDVRVVRALRSGR